MNDPYSKTIEEFREDCRIRGMTPGSTRHYAANVSMLGEFLKERDVLFENATKTDIIDFITFLRDKRGAKAKTLDNYLTSINSLYDFLLFNERISGNIIPAIRRRYLMRYKKDEGNGKRRKVLNPTEMSDFLNSILNPRDKAMATLFVKTGIRRDELISLDVGDIDWSINSITLKNHKKRSNLTVFFDEECARVLKYWLKVRDTLYFEEGCDALFISQKGGRLKRQGVYKAITDWAKRKRFFDTESKENADHFSPHNFRHCFTTYLLDNGMKREYVQELRGDARRDAVDIYNHIPKDKLREAYLAAMPQFGL